MYVYATALFYSFFFNFMIYYFVPVIWRFCLLLFHVFIVKFTIIIYVFILLLFILLFFFCGWMCFFWIHEWMGLNDERRKLIIIINSWEKNKSSRRATTEKVNAMDTWNELFILLMRCWNLFKSCHNIWINGNQKFFTPFFYFILWSSNILMHPSRTTIIKNLYKFTQLDFHFFASLFSRLLCVWYVAQ